MGKGSNTTTTASNSSSSTAPDSAAYQAYQALLQRASGVASTPYQGYTGEQVAPINQQQQAGIGAINTQQGAITATGAPLSAADIQRYQDPYTQSVIDATQRDFEVQNARQQSQVTGNAAAQGALGGDRSAVAAALAAEGQNRTQAPIIAGLRSQGYQQAVKTAEDQQQQALRAGVAGLQGAQAMVGAGTLEQQTQQAQDTQNRLDYYQKQGYPFQVAQWLAQIDTGVGSQMGGTSTSTGTTTKQGPQPNTFAQLAGLGLAGAGLFANRGGRVSGIHRFADGGGVDDGFQDWKRQHAPNDSGEDYDLRGAYEAGILPDSASGHWPDTFKKPNHPTFSDQSMYAVGPEADRAGHWIDVGGQEIFVPPANKARGGVAGYALGGMPWSGEAQSWVPQVSGIAAGRGAPQAPSFVQAAGDDQKSPGLSKDQMKGIGAIGKAGTGWLSDQFGGDVISGAWGGSSSSPLPGLSPDDYGAGYADGGEVLSDADPISVSAGQQFAQSSPYQIRPMGNGQVQVINVRTGQVHYTGTQSGASNAQATLNYRNRAGGGRIRRYANGGYAFGGSPDEDATFDDRFGAAHPNRVVAGVGASRPAFSVVNSDEPYRMPPPEAVESWRSGVDRDIGRGVTEQPKGGEPVELPPEVISGRTKPAPVADEEPADAMGYSGRPRMVSGVGAPPAAPEAPDESFLGRLGVKMTPELKQGLLQAGLAMMATRHGGPGSFLQSAGEAGMAGVGAYNQTAQAALDQAEKQRKEALENAKFGMTQEEHALKQASSPLIRGPDGQMMVNPAWVKMKTQESEITQKDNWAPLPGDGVTPDRMYNKVTGEIKDTPPPKGSLSSPTVPEGKYDYRTGAPQVGKGDAVPDPVPVANKSVDSIKSDAAYYLETGILPKASVAGKSPNARAQLAYQDTIKNYGNALALSRGMTPEMMADVRRFAPQAVRFVLSRQGDQTVALGTSIRHLDSLREYAEAWNKAKGDINAPILRQAAARFSQAWGSSEPTNLQAAARIAAPEVIKAIGVAGAGTGGERMEQERGFQPGASNDQILGAIAVAQEFLAGQLPAKEAQANAVHLPHEKFVNMVGPSEYARLEQLRKGKRPESTGTEPKKGERRQFKQGWGVWDGSKWVPE